MTGGGGGGWPPPEGLSEGGGFDAVVQDETAGSLAGMEFGANSGGFLNACAGPGTSAGVHCGLVEDAFNGEISGSCLLVGGRSAGDSSVLSHVASPFGEGDGDPMLGMLVHGEKVSSLADMEIGVNGDGFLKVCTGSVPSTGMHGDDGSNETMGSQANMEFDVNHGGFLNACTGSRPGFDVHAPVEAPVFEPRLGVSFPGVLVESAAVRMEDEVASSVEKALGSSTAWMDDGSSLQTLPVLDPSGTEVEMFSSPPGELCMGNTHGKQSGGPSFSAPRNDTQGVRHYASAISPSPVSTVHEHVGHLHKQIGSGNVWQWPRRVALPPVNELGVFSMDGATALLDPAEVHATSQRFEAALVGRMFGRHIPFGVLSGELRRRWAVYGNIRIVTLSGDCFVCFFVNMIARDEALLGGPWVVLGQVLGVERWTPEFSLKSSVAFTTPVWTRLPDLPLYCWSSRNIARIAAVVGQPLWLDGATAEFERGSYARVCIRIDLSKPLRSGVWVDGPHGKFFQPLVYEGLSVFCWHCCQVGHKASACSRPSPIGAPKGGRSSVPEGNCEGNVATKVGNPPLDHTQSSSVSMGVDDQLPTSVGNPPTIVDDIADKGAGPGMVVTRKKRPEQVKAGSNKSILGPFRFSGSTGACNIGSVGLKVALPRSVLPIKNNKQKVVGSIALPNAVSKMVMESSAHIMDSLSKGTDVVASIPTMDSFLKDTDVVTSVPTMDTLLKDIECHAFSGFSAQARGNDGRLSWAKGPSRGDKIRGAKKEKMKSDLGPITRGSRKRRKSYSSTDGGDGSPTRPP